MFSVWEADGKAGGLHVYCGSYSARRSVPVYHTQNRCDPGLDENVGSTHLSASVIKIAAILAAP